MCVISITNKGKSTRNRLPARAWTNVRDFTDQVWEKAHFRKHRGAVAGNRATKGVR